MPVTLPTTRNEVTIKSPKKLVIYSSPKVGKTTLAAALDNALLLDLEDGSDFVNAMSVKASTYKEVAEICNEIIKQGKPYKYIMVDTATGLENLAKPLALAIYQATPMGAKFDGDILTLPNGGGYYYLRIAYDRLLDKIQSATERSILFGHLKDKMIDKAGEEVNTKDIDLTGRIKNIVCANADAIGLLLPKGNKRILTFETSEEITCGARPEHLRGKQLVISEKDEATGQIKVYWDRIFID